MNTKTFVQFLAVASWLAGSTTIFAQGTAFTYQGRLNAGGVPATGIYDLRFTIYDSSGGPTVVAGPQTMSGTGVTNGVFVATLDFGASVFTGPGRWLEIAVRTNSGPIFTNLAPRQPLLPTPYAIHAGIASNMANGSVVKSLNNLRDNVTLAAGANVTLTPSGNTVTIASTGGGGNGIWSLNGGSAYYNAGNVGIGTASPAEKLTIAGVSSYNNGLKLTGNAAAGTGLALENTSAGGHQYALLSGGVADAIGVGAFGIFDDTAYDYRLSISPSGNIGIGTPTPLATLHVLNPIDSATCLIDSGGGVNAWSKVGFRNANGQWHVGTSRSFNNDVFYIDRLGNNSLEFQLSTSGSLGLGIEPQRNLHIFDPNNSVSERIETGGGVNAWTRLEFVNANGQWDIGTSRSFNGDQLYFYRQGAPGIAFGIQPNGDAFLQGTMTCKVLTITGADLAEKFPSSDPQPEPGTVMEIDPDRPGQLRISREAYCTRVAGVVSGARDLIAGAVLGNLPESKDSPPIALSGRVWLHGDATGAPIKPGDLLTTSNTPGHAMKVRDHHKAQGAILGKAMSSLNEGKGMVLVLVTLQ